MSTSVFLLVVILTSYIATHDIPVIGILANPMPVDTGDFISSRVNAQYIRWLENAGAVAMVIQPWYTRAQIDEIMSSVNGVIYLGGDRELDLSKQFEQNAGYILEKIIRAKDNGNPIPLWGTCQGLQLIHSLVMGKKDLKDFDSDNFPSPVRILNKNSTIFKFFSEEDFYNAENANVFAEFHFHGILPHQYQQYPVLDQVFDIAATAYDRHGLEYVAIAVGKKYPIYAVQFHPEMISANRRVKSKIITNTESVKIAENLANFFVDEARKNKNAFSLHAIDKFNFIDSFKDRLSYDEDGYYFYEFRNHEKKFIDN
jgi:gamma-glutamyl hydrolase